MTKALIKLSWLPDMDLNHEDRGYLLNAQYRLVSHLCRSSCLDNTTFSAPVNNKFMLNGFKRYEMACGFVSEPCPVSELCRAGKLAFPVSELCLNVLGRVGGVAL